MSILKHCEFSASFNILRHKWRGLKNGRNDLGKKPSEMWTIIYDRKREQRGKEIENETEVRTYLIEWGQSYSSVISKHSAATERPAVQVRLSASPRRVNGSALEDSNTDKWGQSVLHSLALRAIAAGKWKTIELFYWNVLSSGYLSTPSSAAR